MQVSLRSDIGPVRRTNEDSAGWARVRAGDGAAWMLLVVADGVGGGLKGDLASRTAVDSMIRTLSTPGWTEPVRGLLDAFAHANELVYELTACGAASTTLVAALVAEEDGTTCVANVGDSRVYAISAGCATRLTGDHSVAGVRVAAGLMSAAEAARSPDRHVLTRSVGSGRDVAVDVHGPMTLAEGSRLLLCSDGVHGSLDDATVARLAADVPLDEAADRLVTAAFEAGSRDNATALIAGFTAARRQR